MGVEVVKGVEWAKREPEGGQFMGFCCVQEVHGGCRGSREGRRGSGRGGGEGGLEKG